LTSQQSSRQVSELTGKWGILGGTFDPVQLGHLTLASEIQAARDLSGVLFVPAYEPTHKRDRTVAGWEDRLAMVRLAVVDRQAFAVSSIEAEMNLPGYSLNTVRALKQKNPKVQFYFIVGTDLIYELDTWHKPTELLREISILAGTRLLSGCCDDSKRYPSERIEYIETSQVDVSSTLVRELIREGISPNELSDLVGKRVAEYIISRKLYS
jgi:nicotinate-nucleotide adenylyltransferase